MLPSVGRHHFWLGENLGNRSVLEDTFRIATVRGETAGQGRRSLRIVRIDPVTDLLDRWLAGSATKVGPHVLITLAEIPGSRAVVIDDLRAVVSSHYVDPATVSKWLAAHGAPKTAELLAMHLPKTKTARSGDIGEILATEIAERHLGFEVPVRRLRWKDGRNLALRGDDVVGLAREEGKVAFLKGESKSRIRLAASVVTEAGDTLDEDRGRPGRNSVLFVADCLRHQKLDDLAKDLEDAVLKSFAGHRVEHLLFVLSGNDPAPLLAAHLNDCAANPRRRDGVGLQIEDHSEFIRALFEGF